MNWKSVNDVVIKNGGELNCNEYPCQDNRSCNSYVGGGEGVNNNLINSSNAYAGQYYLCGGFNGGKKATIDVEDLGKCFEDHNFYNDQGRTKNLYNKRIIVPHVNHYNRVNCSSAPSSSSSSSSSLGQVPENNNNNHSNNVKKKIVSPSQRMWFNMKAAAFVDDDRVSSKKTSNNNDDNEIKMVVDETTKWQHLQYENEDEEFYSKIIDQLDENNVSSSLINGCSNSSSRFCDEDEERNAENHFVNVDKIIYFDDLTNNEYFDNNSVDYNRRVINQFDDNVDNEESESLRKFNLCSESQWLRCPVANQCPTLNDGYDFNSLQGNNNNNNNIDNNNCNPSRNQNQNLLLPPCFDQSSELMFYYGRDIGYLTPAEFQRYEEDSLSNEKRKEKSRDAARCRRSRETDIFTELATALPVVYEQSKPLDKASVMRLAIAYLKVRTVIDSIPEPLAKSEPSQEMDELFLKALDGFMMVLSSDGDMVYLSENVSEYLGVSQMDLMGQNVYDYSHPCDHEELRECLSMKPQSVSSDDKQTCNLFLRLKCTLTSKGRKVNLKSASYKVIHCTGHMVVTPKDLSAPPMENEDADDVSEIIDSVDCNNDKKEKEKENEKEKDKTGGCLVVVGCPVPHPSNIEAPLGRYTFLSKHNLNMKFTYADEKLAEYLGWDINELVGQSVFEFHHALDNLVLDKSFKSLFSKGQCETSPYRFLGKKGGYAWVVTQATLIHCSKQHKPLSVVCVNYIISGIECENEVYSTRQLEARSVDAEASKEIVSLTATVAISNINNNNIVNKKERIVEEIKEVREDSELKIITSAISSAPIIQERPRPLSVTASLFRSHDKEKVQKDIFTSKKVLDPQKEIFGKSGSIADQVPRFSNTKNNFVDESKKDNNQEINNLIQKQVIHSDQLFQGKPIIKYAPVEIQRVRPQAVTSSLFAPAPQAQEQPPSRPPPQTATASIFAPRTKDMNKGFLTFSEDQPGLTMLKDEPEDLTHLAPTPGDVCVPLEDTQFFSELEDFMTLGNDNYCPLLSPSPTELRSSEEIGESIKDSDLEESLRNSELGESLADSGDPFMYRDSPSSCSGSPNLLSPALSKSPGSIDSICSQSGSGGGLSEDEMLMLSINDVLHDEELSLRAPYIPMSDQDETLQLFISNDMVMWPQPPDKKTKWCNVNDNVETSVSSSLEQLLRTSSGNGKKYNDHGGGLVDPLDALGNIYKKNTKEDTNSWLSKSERSNKRVHCTTENIDNDNVSNKKRIKCEERELLGNININLNVNVNTNTNSNTNSKGNVNVVSSSRLGNNSNNNSQLLQQLMSQQSPSKNHLDNNNADGNGKKSVGNVGCGSDESLQQQQQQQQQSNSVLMNLLVSGCDEVIDPRNVPPLNCQRKISSPLSLNLDNHTVITEIPSISVLEHLSPDTRNELVNSMPRISVNKPNVSNEAIETMDFDNFEFDVSSLSSELLQGSDLLKILANNFG